MDRLSGLQILQNKSALIHGFTVPRFKIDRDNWSIPKLEQYWIVRDGLVDQLVKYIDGALSQNIYKYRWHSDFNVYDKINS